MNNGMSFNRTAFNGWAGDTTVRVQVVAYALATAVAVRGTLFRRSPVTGSAVSQALLVDRVRRMAPITGQASAVCAITPRGYRYAMSPVSGAAASTAMVMGVVKPRTDLRSDVAGVARAAAVIVPKRHVRFGALPVAQAVGLLSIKTWSRSPLAGVARADGAIDASVFKQIPWDEAADDDNRFVVVAQPHLFYVRGPMTVVAKVRQQPNDVQDYDISFDEWFPVGDGIRTVVLSCSPVPPVPPSYAIDSTKRVVKVWFYAGGASGTDYKVTVRATTTDGGLPGPDLRTKEAELVVKVREV